MSGKEAPEHDGNNLKSSSLLAQEPEESIVYHLFACCCMELHGGMSSVTAPAGVVVPPLNFAMVSPGVYRSGYPRAVNHTFLRSIALKTVIYLCPEDYSEANIKFCEEEDITLLQFGIQGNKEPFVDIPEVVIREALQVLLDVRRHPLLLHCNKGKHRTGCLVGCLRKVQRWSLTSIFDEYRRYAGTKTRDLDQQFIELFQTGLVRYRVKYTPAWLA